MSLFEPPGVVSIKCKSGILVELKRFCKCFVYFDGHILILAVIDDGYLNFYYYEGFSLDNPRDGVVLSLDGMNSIDWVMGGPGCFGNEDFQYSSVGELYLLLTSH